MSWISDRHNCTVQQQFMQMKDDVAALVNERNATLQDEVFQCEVDRSIIVVSKREDVREVRIVHRMKRILVGLADGDRFTALPKLANDGRCLFDIIYGDADKGGDADLEVTRERVLQNALEGFFFS